MPFLTSMPRSSVGGVLLIGARLHPNGRIFGRGCHDSTSFEHACLSKFSRSILKKLARELLCLIQSEKLTQASPVHWTIQTPSPGNITKEDQTTEKTWYPLLSEMLTAAFENASRRRLHRHEVTR